MGAESASRVWFETGGRGKSRSRRLVVGGWLAGAQGKAIGPGFEGGGVRCGSRLTGWWELAVEGNLEGLGWGPEGWWAAGTCALCRIWLVRTWCLQETPRNRADDRTTPSSTRPAGCRVVCSSQRMCAFPSVHCVECVSGKAHHCRPVSACPQHLFSNRILPFVFPFSLSSRHSGRLDACRTMPAGSGTKAIAPAIHFGHLMSSGVRMSNMSNIQSMGYCER